MAAGQYIYALLGKIFNRGSELELGNGINFAPPLRATPNTSTGSIDIELDTEGSGTTVEVLQVYSAGGGGTVDDVNTGFSPVLIPTPATTGETAILQAGGVNAEVTSLATSDLLVLATATVTVNGSADAPFTAALAIDKNGDTLGETSSDFAQYARLQDVDDLVCITCTRLLRLVENDVIQPCVFVSEEISGGTITLSGVSFSLVDLPPIA